MEEPTIAINGSTTKIVLAVIALLTIIVVPIVSSITQWKLAKLVAETKIEAEENADIVEAKVDGVHVLVNDQLTQEKGLRLLTLQTNRRILSQTIGTEMSEDDSRLLANLDRQIAGLQAEIDGRNAAAATLTEEQKVSP